MKDKVFTFHNGKEYYILDSIIFNNQEYYCAIEVQEEQQNIGNRFYIFEKIENPIEPVKLLEDKNIEDEVRKLFAQRISNI